MKIVESVEPDDNFRSNRADDFSADQLDGISFQVAKPRHIGVQRHFGKGSLALLITYSAHMLKSKADDMALLIYTSGTTGAPKARAEPFFEPLQAFFFLMVFEQSTCHFLLLVEKHGLMGTSMMQSLNPPNLPFAVLAG